MADWKIGMSNYQTRSAVLFIIFNRSDTSLQVLGQIKNANPSRLYITADGARRDKPGEDFRCAETRKAVLKAIDWECEVKTLFRDKNLGPKEAISSAIDWFFEHEPEGIVLEHDCLPSNSFFMFMDAMIERYRLDSRIWLISGCNFQNGKKYGDATYYFSNLTNGWGWATWRRSWAQYDKYLSNYNEDEVKPQLEKIFDNPIFVDRWIEIFKDTKAGKIDTWDYQATFTHFFNHCINIVPNYNLVSNIGFGELAENTLDAGSLFAAVPLQDIDKITHPKYMLPEKEADNNTMYNEFQIAQKLAALQKYNAPKRRFRRWFKNLLK